MTTTTKQNRCSSRAVAAERLKRIRALRAEGKRSKEIGLLLGVHHATVRYYLSDKCKVTEAEA